MLNFNEINIQEVIVHHIGSRPEEEGVQLSNDPIQLNDDLTSECLKSIFFHHLSQANYITLQTTKILT